MRLSLSTAHGDNGHRFDLISSMESAKSPPFLVNARSPIGILTAGIYRI